MTEGGYPIDTLIGGCEYVRNCQRHGKQEACNGIARYVIEPYVPDPIEDIIGSGDALRVCDIHVTIAASENGWSVFMATRLGE